MTEQVAAAGMANGSFTPLAEPAPLIVRVAGLPAEAVTPFASDLGARVAHLRDLEADLARARQDLVDQLHGAIHEAPPGDRRLLLAVKRDSFNGRSLRRYRSGPAVLQRIPGLATALDLEDQWAALESGFQVAYVAQFERERSALTGLLTDRRFLRGIAMSSPLLVEQLPRLEESDRQEEPGRRDRRLLLSLLRYVSRAALKLSPFASLTRVGIGLVAPTSSDGDLQLVGPASWSERSHVSLHRSLLERLAHVLLSYRPFRDGLRVSLNPTLDSPSPGKFAFIRPALWEDTSEPPHLRIVQPSRVKVGLKGPVIAWLLESLPIASRTYSELLTALAAAFSHSSPKELRRTVDQLLQIGFLCFVWPWEVSDPAPEACLLAALERLADDAGREALLPPLRAMAATMAGFPQSEAPGEAIEQGKEQLHAALRAAAGLGGLSPGIGTVETREWFFHEDVFVGSELPSHAVAVLSPSRSWGLLRDLAPLARLAELFSLRHDFLLTLAAFAADRWPGHQTLGFLDFFDAAYPLFRELIRFDKGSRRGGPLRAHAFNPLDLPALRELLDHRARTLEALPGFIADAGPEHRLQHDALQRFLDTLPAQYTRERDFCAFLQPADERGGRWVLNNLLEGAGRMGSRYTTVMAPAAQERFTSAFRARSRYAGAWYAGDLCDLFWPGGQSVNVHAYQTERVLAMPGQTLEIDLERRISPSTLKVRLRGPGRPPCLTDDLDRVLLPVHLGALAFRYLPSLAKLLTYFGPGEIRLCTPQREPQACDDVEVSQRHVLGDVVYRRKSWSFAVSDLRSQLSGLSSPQVFTAIDRWRAGHGIPERAYLAEPIPRSGASPHLKPQYIDFTSCLFVDLFRAALERGDERLKIFEALPDPGELTPTGHGGRLAVEIQLDSFGFTQPTNTTEPMDQWEDFHYPTPDTVPAASTAAQDRTAQ